MELCPLVVLLIDWQRERERERVGEWCISVRTVDVRCSS
jgi:hypothetical protein